MQYETAHTVFRAAVEDRALCPWCFRQIRILYPEDDEAEARHLSRGDTEQIFLAKGHRINADGEVEVSYSSAEPHYSTLYGTPPETMLDGQFRSATPQSICQCGVIDFASDNRSLALLHTCVDNLNTWYANQEYPALSDSIDEEAAHNVVSQLRRYDSLVGKDEIVLTESLRQGLDYE